MEFKTIHIVTNDLLNEWPIIIKLKMQMSCERKRKREFLWYKKESTNCQRDEKKQKLYIRHTMTMTVSVFVKKYRGTFTFLLDFYLFFCSFFLSTNICLSNCQQIQNHKHTNPVRMRSFQLEQTKCLLCVQWGRWYDIQIEGKLFMWIRNECDRRRRNKREKGEKERKNEKQETIHDGTKTQKRKYGS